MCPHFGALTGILTDVLFGALNDALTGARLDVLVEYSVRHKEQQLVQLSVHRHLPSI